MIVGETAQNSKDLFFDSSVIICIIDLSIKQYSPGLGDRGNYPCEYRTGG